MIISICISVSINVYNYRQTARSPPPPRHRPFRYMCRQVQPSCETLPKYVALLWLDVSQPWSALLHYFAFTTSREENSPQQKLWKSWKRYLDIFSCIFVDLYNSETLSTVSWRVGSNLFFSTSDWSKIVSVILASLWSGEPRELRSRILFSTKYIYCLVCIKV